MLIAGLRVHEEEKLADRFGGPHPTGEPSGARKTQTAAHALAARISLKPSARLTAMCQEFGFLGPLFVRADPDGRSLRELKTRAEGAEEQGQAG